MRTRKTTVIPRTKSSSRSCKRSNVTTAFRDGADDMATPAADRTIDAPSPRQGSPERFGYSWDRFHDITPEQELQFNKWTCLVDPETGWRGKAVLDVGCGAGRNAVFAMRAGAARCLAIDVDERSLQRARTNLAGFPTPRCAGSAPTISTRATNSIWRSASA